jgi:hypothetical protein
VFWAKENPHFAIELENNTPHMMLWAGVTARHFLSLYFSNRPVNAATHMKMLRGLPGIRTDQ